MARDEVEILSSSTGRIHMPKSKEQPSYEQLFSELEATVAKLEAGDLPLDESLALYQRGMELAKKCGELLDHAELRVRELMPQVGEPGEEAEWEEEEEA
jgi:exodeoxyribonuclease VII small subunit